jgi:hypothetical protein
MDFHRPGPPAAGGAHGRAARGPLLVGVPDPASLEPASPEGRPLATLAGGYGLTPQARLAAVRAFFASLTPEQVARLAV